MKKIFVTFGGRGYQIAWFMTFASLYLCFALSSHPLYSWVPDFFSSVFLLNVGVQGENYSNAMLSAFISFLTLSITFTGDHFSKIANKKEQDKIDEENRKVFISELLFECQEFTLSMYQAFDDVRFVTELNNKNDGTEVLILLGNIIQPKKPIFGAVSSLYHDTTSLFFESLKSTSRILKWIKKNQDKLEKEKFFLKKDIINNIHKHLCRTRSIKENIKGNNFATPVYITTDGNPIENYPEILINAISHIEGGLPYTIKSQEPLKIVREYYSALETSLNIVIELNKQCKINHGELYKDYIKNNKRTIG